MLNLEVKTPLDDRVAMEHRLRGLGATRVWTRRQTDTFYEVPDGLLKLREAEGAAAELISYHRVDGVSDYDLATLDDAERWKRLIGRVLPVAATVAKERTLWMVRHTRVHLDDVDGLGDYLELETVLVDGLDRAAGQREHESVIEGLGLDRERFIAVPYRELLARV